MTSAGTTSIDAGHLVSGFTGALCVSGLPSLTIAFPVTGSYQTVARSPGRGISSRGSSRMVSARAVIPSARV
jgi:hypothetical protein